MKQNQVDTQDGIGMIGGMMIEVETLGDILTEIETRTEAQKVAESQRERETQKEADIQIEIETLKEAEIETEVEAEVQGGRAHIEMRKNPETGTDQEVEVGTDDVPRH